MIHESLLKNVPEFFYNDGKHMCLLNGNVLSFENIPEKVLELVKSDLYKNSKALNALQAWDILCEKEQLKQYIFCRYGNFDQSPDFNNQETFSEHVNCAIRGKCPHEGKICTTIKLKNGFLTKKETEVLSYLGKSLLDKEICSLLNISAETLRSHKDNICQKAGINRKPALAILAHQLNLI